MKFKLNDKVSIDTKIPVDHIAQLHPDFDNLPLSIEEEAEQFATSLGFDKDSLETKTMHKRLVKAFIAGYNLKTKVN